MKLRKPIDTVVWGGRTVRLLDQRKLPARVTYLACTSARDIHDAIRTLAVRGAPAIGVAGAMGLALAAVRSSARDARSLLRELERASRYLVGARPTAVNLSWGLARMIARARKTERRGVQALREALVREACEIKAEDEALCLAIGRHGSVLISPRDCVLTHCNAGGLATSGFGTALAVLYVAHACGKRVSVYACETRPLLQGSRLTVWELSQAGLPVTLVCDNMVGTLMQQGRIRKVIVGADRIASNGDTANKIGTYGIAVLAKHHGVPFYVAAPSSSFDFRARSGAAIPIEERAPEEVTHVAGKRIAPVGTRAYNPAFDVTPHELITGIITEAGVLRAPFRRAIGRLARRSRST